MLADWRICGLRELETESFPIVVGEDLTELAERTALALAAREDLDRIESIWIERWCPD